MLRFIKPLLVLLFLGAVIGGGYYLYQTKFNPDQKNNQQILGTFQDLTNQEQFQDGIKSINLESLQKTTQLTTKQLEQLGQNSQVVKDHFSKIISETPQDSSSSSQENQSLQEKAFEYGRYVYCQEVVKDYESRHQTN